MHLNRHKLHTKSGLPLHHLQVLKKLNFGSWQATKGFAYHPLSKGSIPNKIQGEKNFLMK